MTHIFVASSSSPPGPLPHVPCLRAALPVVEARLALRLARPVQLPEFPTVTLRGLLGYALLAHLHPLHPHDPHPDSFYWRLFKPPDRRPHPFLLDCAPGTGPALVLRASLRFFGSGQHFLPLCLDALRNYQPHGFGPQRVPYRLEVEEVRRPTVPWSPHWRPHATGRFALLLLTPVQLTWRNQELQPDGPLLHALAWAAVRRTQALAEAYGQDLHIDVEAVNAAIEASRLTRAALERLNLWRSSSLADRPVPIGGLRGRVELEGPPEMERILRAAELVAVGKKVVGGNGRVRLVEMA